MKQNRFWGLASYLAQPDQSVSCWRHKRYAILKKGRYEGKKQAEPQQWATVYGRLGLAFENKDCINQTSHESPASTGDEKFNWLNNMDAKNLPFFDLSDAFDPPHDYREIFCIKGHINELGYKILAEKYFTFLTTNNFFRDKEFNYPAPPPISHRYGIPAQFEQGGAKISTTRNWSNTNKLCGRKKFQSEQSS